MFVKSRRARMEELRLRSLSAEINNVENQLMGFKKNFAEQLKKKKKEEATHEQVKYYCSICLIIRDENEYLQEWLEWHVGQGVEHFYIYDHGSKQPVAEFIKTLDEDMQVKITVIDFSGQHEYAQHEAYNDCLRRFGKENHWIGYIDSDEMVRVKENKTLPQFLREFESYAGLFVVWIMYGTNGHKQKLNLPCRERFSEISTITDPLGKVFIQPKLMRKMLTHNGFPVEGFQVVDEYKEPVGIDRSS